MLILRAVVAGSGELSRVSRLREGSAPDAALDNEHTWTAGMTKGKAPPELQAQLQQFRELKRTRRWAGPRAT